MMFDTTSYGEYKSFSSSGLGQSQPCEEEEAVEEEEDGRLVDLEELYLSLCKLTSIFQFDIGCEFMCFIPQIRKRSS